MKIVGNDVVVQTLGVGTGDWKLINVTFGPLIFGEIDKHLATAVDARLSARAKKP